MVLLLTNAALCLSSTTSKDCTKFSGALAPRPLIASVWINTVDVLVVDVECDNGYLLVPANASPIHCNNVTGWDIPQCKGIYTWERGRGGGGWGGEGRSMGGERDIDYLLFCFHGSHTWGGVHQWQPQSSHGTAATEHTSSPGWRVCEVVHSRRNH